VSVNRVVIQGNLVQDPDLKYMPNGKAVLEVTIASNRKWKDANGEQRSEATFVDCKAYDKRAEVIAKYFGKGRPVIFEGRLQTDQWQDKESGKTRYALRLVVSDIHFVGGGDDKGSQSTAQTSTARTAQPVASQPTDDEVPF
jgi:single-strand DNA-binding protein